MVYIEPIGGLCNRMRSIASAMDIANQLCTSLTVLWQLDSGLNCRFEDLFEPIPNVTFITFKRFSLKRLWYTQSCRKGAKRYNNINNADNINFVKNSNIYIKTPHQFIREIDFSIFVPHSKYISAANELIGNANSIGIHIRRTDNIKSIENSPTELFLDEIRNRIREDGDIRFFLATDSVEEELKIKSEYGDYILTQKKKNLSRNSTEGIQNALIDLICLAHCDEIWGSYWSSFSETAAAWYGKKTLRVISKKG